MCPTLGLGSATATTWNLSWIASSSLPTAEGKVGRSHWPTSFRLSRRYFAVFFFLFFFSLLFPGDESHLNEHTDHSAPHHRSRYKHALSQACETQIQSRSTPLHVLPPLLFDHFLYSSIVEKKMGVPLFNPEDLLLEHGRKATKIEAEIQQRCGIEFRASCTKRRFKDSWVNPVFQYQVSMQNRFKYHAC